MRDFFRFSIRQILVLVVTLSLCLAVNRDNGFLDVFKWIVVLPLFAVFSPPFVLIFIRFWQVRRDRPDPPES